MFSKYRLLYLSCSTIFEKNAKNDDESMLRGNEIRLLSVSDNRQEMET